MSFDALLKRCYPAVLLALIAGAAYYQAAGLAQLLGAMVAVTTTSSIPTATQKPALGKLTPRTSKDAAPILERNVFDSVTGPIGKEPDADLDPTSTSRNLDLSDPLGAPECSDLKVAIITESNDPVWSIAALQGSGETKPKIRRVGDSVGDKEVAYIGFNPKRASPAVWLTSGASLCQGLLFTSQAAPASKAAAAKEEPEPEEANKGRRGPSKVPDDIAAGIQKLSATEFNIERSVVDKILESQAELMKSARIVPEQKDGQVVGIRLFGVRPDTLLGTLGLQNGDRLETINGFNMASPEKALEAYARLRTADSLAVKISRRGKPQTIDYHIK